jgi:enterochelin esterase family protein
MRRAILRSACSLLLFACSDASSGDGDADSGTTTTTGMGTDSTGPGAETSADTTLGPQASSGEDTAVTSSEGSSSGTTGCVNDPSPEGDGDYEIGPDYADAPEIVPGPDVPRGDVYYFSMDSADSAIFPGVTGPYTRDVWVYVPQQYVDGTEAPFMVVQDGGGYLDLTTATLDTLIDQAEVPALIGIFINPGPGDGMGSERGLEYDRVSEDYTNFIETEVLPIIPLQPEIAAAHPGLAFTDDPEGRASMGGSSGGACAFTMGWLRPDLYRRILTYSGTFVRQHSTDEYPGGAWEYHQHLIAESEELPLRVFLQVGEFDNNLDDVFGDGMHDWVAANEAMAAALAAKTYHYRYLYSIEAGHVDGRVLRQTLPETLRWLWRGYPSEC